MMKPRRIVGLSRMSVRAASSLLLIAGVAGTPAAGQMSFEPLGIPAGFPSSAGLCVSGDGLTAGGSAGAAAAAWWWRGGQLMMIPPTTSGWTGQALGMNATGSYIVGTIGATTNGFRYSTATGVVDVLPIFGASGRLLPYDVTEDGQRLFGGHVTGFYVARPVPEYWTQAGGPVQLPLPTNAPFPNPDLGTANAATPDGSVIVGTSFAFSNSAGPAFRYTAAGGSQSLGYLIPNPVAPPHSGANDVTPDGSVVVGWSDSASGRHAFRWTQAGGMVDLGLIAGAVVMTAEAVSADGSVIIGEGATTTSSTFGESRAFIWDAAHGARDLRRVLLEAGSSGPLLGWTLNLAHALSADGKTIVGTGTDEQGRVQAYIARLIPPPCYANCDGSLTPPLVNVNDFVCFLNLYAAGDAYANCDGSTQPPVLNVNDFQCFLNAFAQGC